MICNCGEVSVKFHVVLQELSERNDIVITKADKGGTVVIIDVKDYVGKAEFQLKSKNYYDRLNYDPTETHNRLLNDHRKIYKAKDDERKSCQRIKDRKPENTKTLFTNKST